MRQLKLLYGNTNRKDAFRAQLDALRLTPGQSLADLFDEVQRLFESAHPDKDNDTVDATGRTAFYRALSDREFLRARQLQYLVDMDDALSVALSMEPIFYSSDQKKMEELRRNVRVVDTGDDERKKCKHLEKLLADQKKTTEFWKNKATSLASSVPASSSAGGSDQPLPVVFPTVAPSVNGTMPYQMMPHYSQPQPLPQFLPSSCL